VAEAEVTVAEVARAGRAGAGSGRSVAGSGSSEFRSDFPRGSDFVDSGDGFSQRAAEAYRRIAGLWDGAVEGTLSPTRTAEFRNLAAHEYVENRLMEAGLPYRSSHPDAFDADGDRILHRDHPGAHELAPNEWRPHAPFEHWQRFGLDGSGLRMAEDLSNLEEIVDAALRGWGR
jgi:hypothetical protein